LPDLQEISVCKGIPSFETRHVSSLCEKEFEITSL